MIAGMSLESFIGASSKFLAEQVARDAARVGGSVVVVNPSTPVGRSAQGISFWWRGKDTGKMPAIRHWAGCIHFLCHARTVRAPRRPRSCASMGRSSGTHPGEGRALQAGYAQPSDYRAPG